jgi:hypothetical protein
MCLSLQVGSDEEGAPDETNETLPKISTEASSPEVVRDQRYSSSDRSGCLRERKALKAAAGYGAESK